MDFFSAIDRKVSKYLQGDGIYQFSRIVCFVVALLFFMNQVLGLFEGFVKTEVIGQYGDFVGGVIGTILSVVLLADTFKSQIKEAKNNAQVFESQQLNELVFHLLDQYNSVVASFNIEKDDAQGIKTVFKGKEGLHYALVKMQEEFASPHIAHSRKVALGLFQSFYDSHEDFAPIYFCTIYRIFDVINKAEVKDDVKVKYAKLIRCQFTETELVMIRYNAMWQVGKNMRALINEFNLLKHIRPLELLEYLEWRNRFTASNRHKVNILLYMVQKQVHDLFLSDDTTRAITSIKTKYNINVSKLTNGTVCKFDFTRNTRIQINYDLFTCFDSVTIEEIKSLFVTWFKEIFVYSNYGLFNYRVEINSDGVERNVPKEHFSLIIARPDHKKLIVSSVQISIFSSSTDIR